MMESRRWWALGALAIALLTFGLDVTVLNVALPTLATDLRASTSQLQWFANAYTLVLAAGLIPAGLLGDRFGPKKLLLGSLALFGAASVFCAYAGSAEMLILARAVLGVGAAFMVPLSASLLTVLFPPAERGRAIAVWATAMALGIPLGPVLGGWLLDNFWWGSVFLINVPLVVIAIAALAWLVPDVRGTRGLRIDFTGIALSSAGLVALTYGLVEAGGQGWGSADAVLPMTAGVLVLAGFGLWLRRAAHPLVDLGLFRSPGFTWGALLTTIASFSLMGLMFVLPQYFQAVGGTDALGTGLRLLPIVGGLLVGVRIADKLREPLGAKIVVATGFVLMAAGLIIGTTTGVQDSYGFTAVWVSIVGIGLGFSMPPAMDVAMGALREKHSGVGSGLIQAMRQVGGTLGVAILGTVLNDGFRAELPVPVDSAAAGVRIPGMMDAVRDAFVHGMDSMLWVCSGFAVLGTLLTLAFLPRQPQDTEQSEHEYVAG
jgi:EmrB/QacA subfamily drug resistance transporter